MAVINLRNVVALGVLEDGVYPSVYNGQTGEYIGTVDGEGAGVKQFLHYICTIERTATYIYIGQRRGLK